MQYRQPSASLVCLESALHPGPNHRRTRLALADYYWRQGNDDVAAEHRRLASGSE